MKKIYFLRHAKSEWGNFDGDDLNRDISEIGIEKTKKIGSFLRNEKIVFDKSLRKFIEARKTWCASSTHKTEEIFCAKAHMKLKKKINNFIT